MPKLHQIIETALYVEDMSRARAFYEQTLGLKALLELDRLIAYDVGGRSVLLIFKRGGSLEMQHLPGGEVPPHDGAGPVHMCFAIQKDELPAWEAQFAEKQVAIIGRTKWPQGGESIYFHDPDKHVLELLTPGFWAIY